MNYNDTLSYIHSLGNFSLPAGLNRITSVCKKLGNPQNKFPAIHIAGTNGKGSVSVMLAKIFETAGYKTGLYISPYIIEFRERIQVNGDFISEADLCRLSSCVRDTKVTLSEFEFITAVAFSYFAEQKCDIVICETGLGGRFDATNILGNKKCAVICKIGLDHTAVLGDTIEKITAEKCGIIKTCPVVSNPNQPNKAMAVIKQHTDNLFIPDIAEFKNLDNDTFIYKGEEYKFSLKGNFQKENAITVLEVIDSLDYDISYNVIRSALEKTFFPARMEIVSDKPLIILDGAHNPDGAFVLGEEIKKYGGNATAIIGVMQDKNYEEVLKLTLPNCKNAVATQVANMPRSLSAKELKIKAEKYCNCYCETDYNLAIKKAIKLSGGEPVFIFGSLYLASALRPLLKEKLNNLI